MLKFAACPLQGWTGQRPGSQLRVQGARALGLSGTQRFLAVFEYEDTA